MMSNIDNIPIRLLKHRVDVESPSSFSNSEQTNLNLWSINKGGSTTHHIDFFTTSLANKRAILNKLRNSQWVNLFLSEEGQIFYPLTGDPNYLGGIVCVPMTFDWYLWSYQQQLFKFKASFVEAEASIGGN